jgi:hypothetical protein
MRNAAWQFVGVLLLLGFVGAYFWWIVAALAVAGLAWLIAKAVQDMDARHLAELGRRAALIKRADQQHAWVLAGDDRGVYGPAGAALMRDVRR